MFGTADQISGTRVGQESEAGYEARNGPELGVAVLSLVRVIAGNNRVVV